MIWESLISPVTGIINSVINKVAGDKMSELDKAKIELEASELVQEALQQQEDSFRQFVLDYEGSAKDMPIFIQILRGSVRPVLTYVLALFWIAGYSYMFIVSAIPPEKKAILTEVMDLLFKLNLISLSFWYGEKLITRTGLASIIKKKG
jgi:hypothetical protein